MAKPRLSVLPAEGSESAQYSHVVPSVEKQSYGFGILEAIYTGGLCITCLLATLGTMATGCGPSIISRLPFKVRYRAQGQDIGKGAFCVRMHHPTAGLTLCTDFLTLESVSARHATESVEVFPEFTITRPVVGGPDGADGIKLHRTGAFHSDPAR